MPCFLLLSESSSTVCIAGGDVLDSDEEADARYEQVDQKELERRRKMRIMALQSDNEHTFPAFVLHFWSTYAR